MTIATKFARRLCTLLAAFGLMLSLGTAQAQTVIYYHTDALGSPVATTDASGTVIERSEYEPYGKLLNGPLKDGPGYTGHVSDAETGLSYMQQRYYDPQIGRFLSMDPVTADANTGGNFNRYWYANNNPYKFTDPDGREVKFAGGSPSDFLRNVARGIRYLNANGLANNVGQAHMHKEVITISPTQDRSNVYQNHYDPNTKTLYWADKAALQITDTKTGDTGVRSPSLILGHEFEHVMNHLTSVKDYVTDANTPDAQYNTREERNVIEEYENPAAEKLGEPTRSDHSSGEQVPAKCIETEC